jgi:hypothetical protein
MILKHFVTGTADPAVSFSPKEAMALLVPGEAWTAVDGADVFTSGRVIASEAAFKSMFESTFAPFPSRLNSKND